MLLISTIYWEETFTYIVSNSQNKAGARVLVPLIYNEKIEV